MTSDGPFVSRLVAELRTRRVFRVALTYAAIAFAGLQAGDVVISPLAGERVFRWVVVATLAGFPVALALAWFFELRRTRGPASARHEANGRIRAGSSRKYAAGIAVVILAGAGLYGYRTAVAQETVASGAELIAVAPFTALGGSAEVRALGEGLAQLVAANLDQVGGLRTVDPARVRRTWRGTAEGQRSQDDDMARGRQLGAGSVLIGSVVAAGDEARLSAVLRSVGGRELARAQATGPAADVLLLADTLSNRLLRGVWRSHSPVPQLRIAAITTGNLDAIRAYLEGERYYRSLQWDSAIAALRRAVEADSTFALAHRRLADVYGWSGDMASPLRTREEEAAARRPERLPERERAIALAYLAWSRDGDHQEALDSLESHLRRYPDDAEALDLRAEVLLHGTLDGVFHEPDSANLAAFEEALKVDPDLTPAMLHPVALSATLGDTARFRRYAGSLLRARIGADAAVEPLVDSIMMLLWDDAPVPPHFALRYNTDPALRTVANMVPVLHIRLLNGLDPNGFADVMLKALDDPSDGGNADLSARASVSALARLASALVLTGRFTDAERVLDHLPATPEFAVPVRAMPVLLGLTDRDFTGQIWPVSDFPILNDVPAAWRAPAQALLDLSAADTAAAARALAAASAASDLPPAVEALRRFEEGWMRRIRGDAAGGLGDMEAAVAAMEAAPPTPVTPPPDVLRLLLALAWADEPATRDRGIEALGHSIAIPAVRLHLAQALEEDGRIEEARKQYAIFVMQTRRAEGRARQFHDEAEAALVRLTREPM